MDIFEGYVAEIRKVLIKEVLSRDRKGADKSRSILRIPRTGRGCRRKRAAIEADRFSGDDSERVPPDPISNSEVKTFSADDSVIYSCESRTLPEI